MVRPGEALLYWMVLVGTLDTEDRGVADGKVEEEGELVGVPLPLLDTLPHSDPVPVCVVVLVGVGVWEGEVEEEREALDVPLPPPPKGGEGEAVMDAAGDREP